MEWLGGHWYRLVFWQTWVQSQCPHSSYLDMTRRKPSPPTAMTNETTHVKCVVHTAFAKNVSVDMWHLLFQKLILSRPILVTWRYRIGVY